MVEQRKCIECGRLFTPSDEMQMRCNDCNSKHDFKKKNNWEERTNRKRNGVSSMRHNRQRRDDQSVRIPKECIFDSFYDDNGNLKPEIFLDCAKKVAKVFESVNITASAIRKFFNMVKAIEIRLNAEPSLEIGSVRESILKLVPLVNYQYNRGVVHHSIVEFIEGHHKTAMKSRKEFKGFAQYFTSIICYLKQK